MTATHSVSGLILGVLLNAWEAIHGAAGNYAREPASSGWKGISSMLPALIFSVALMAEAHASPPPAVQVEINYLLEYVKNSGCEFYRNGSWYDSTRAQAHLRYKYEALSARDKIASAEDFIEAAATKSSLSGRPYQIRCGSSEVIGSNWWLRDALSRFRTNGAPRDSRGAPQDINRLF